MARGPLFVAAALAAVGACTHDFDRFEPDSFGSPVSPQDCADAGLTLCGTRCTNTKFDPSACGACGHDCGEGSCIDGECQCGTAGPCGPGASCVGGICACPTGLTACPSGCVDTMTDEANCGGCSNPCSTSRQCVNGSCQ